MEPDEQDVKNIAENVGRIKQINLINFFKLNPYV